MIQNDKCLFLIEDHAMEGTMTFCLNPNAYDLKDIYNSIFPRCDDCRFFCDARKARCEIAEKQRKEKEK